MLKMLKIQAMAAMLVLCAWTLNIQAANAPANERVTVVAEGSGLTKMSALKDAWIAAVREAVGAYMASRSETKSDGLNDSYTEQIAAYSRGQVDSFELLSESEANGLWTVKIRANVDRDVLQQTVAEATSKTVKVDGANLAAQAESAANKKKDAEEVLDASTLLDFKNCLEYIPSLVNYKIDGQTVYFMQHVLKFDLNKYKSQTDSLEKLVSKMSTKKMTVKLLQDPAKNAFSIIRSNNYPVIVKPEIKIPEHIKRISKTSFVDNLAYFLYNQNLVPDSTSDKLPGIRTVYNKGESQSTYTIKDFKFEDKNYTQKAYFTYNEPFPIEDPWCFITSPTRANCYEVEDSLKSLKVENIFDLIFSVSAPNLPELEDSEVSLLIGLPPLYNFSGPNRQCNWMIAPQLLYNSQKSTDNQIQLMYFTVYTPVIIAWQKLDLKTEALAGLNELTGKYELSPRDIQVVQHK